MPLATWMLATASAAFSLAWRCAAPPSSAMALQIFLWPAFQCFDWQDCWQYHTLLQRLQLESFGAASPQLEQVFCGGGGIIQRDDKKPSEKERYS